MLGTNAIAFSVFHLEVVEVWESAATRFRRRAADSTVSTLDRVGGDFWARAKVGTVAGADLGIGGSVLAGKGFAILVGESKHTAPVWVTTDDTFWEGFAILAGESAGSVSG